MQATDLSSDRCEMHHLMHAADKNERQSHPLHHIVALEATGFATGGAEMICVGLAMAASVSVKDLSLQDIYVKPNTFLMKSNGLYLDIGRRINSVLLFAIPFRIA